MKKLRFMFYAATAAIGLATVAQADNFTAGLANEWVGDDYTYGGAWVDRVSGASANPDGYPLPPVVVTNVFGTHSGVQRDPSGDSTTDAGFNISGDNAPTGYTNYTVSAVTYSTIAGPNNGAYYGSQLIVGYDIGGPGQTDWGFSWGGNTSSSFVAGIGLSNGADQGLNSPAVALSAVHAVALQVGGGTMSLYVDGAMVAQQTGLATEAPVTQQGVIPLLSLVGANIGQVFPGALAELRIYTNSTVDGAALTAYLHTNYAFQAAVTLSTNTTGAIVGSNAMVTLSVPPSATASSPLAITLTSGNTAVVASQTVTLPTGVTSTNLGLPILATGVSTVTASATGLTPGVLQVTGVLPTITFTPGAASATVGNNATAILTLASPYPFSGPYTVTLTSDNSTVVAGQTVTVPAGTNAVNVDFPVLATGFANLTATGDGLNLANFVVGTMPEILNDGLNNQWVADDYTVGNAWIDRIQFAAASLDGNATPPVILSGNGLFGGHSAVQRDPAGGSSDAGFSIPSYNAPSGYSNYTVAAVIYPTAAGPKTPNYYGGQIIIGYDIGGAGQADWGISWGGTNLAESAIAGMGTATANVDKLLESPDMSLNKVHAVALQVGNNTMSLYLDGALVAQANNVPIHAPQAPSVIPLLSTVGANIGTTFAGALTELRIYTNSSVDGAMLTSTMRSDYTYQEFITVNTANTGAIVGSNAMVTFTVPSSVTASSPATLTLTSGNPAVTVSQTVSLPKGVTSTNVSLPILTTGVSTVTASVSVPNVGSAQVQVSGALPVVMFTPGVASAAVAHNATVTMTLACPYPFSGPYTVTLTSDNTTVAAGQTVTVPAGAASASVTFPVLSTGYATVTATGSGLNSGAIAVGTLPEVFNSGLGNDWVGDDYDPTSGIGWVDRISGVTASLDGNPTPPISVSGLFWGHKGVQRDPAGGGNDGGFSIPSGNAPTGYTNYTVSAVIYPTTVSPNTGPYYASQLIVGYDIGGAGRTDWGISWGGNGGSAPTFGMGLASGSDELLYSPAVSINAVHAVAVQVEPQAGSIDGSSTASFYVDGVLVAQDLNLPVQAPQPPSVLPLLSGVGANIGQVFPGALAELRIYTNNVVDPAALTSYQLSQSSIETPVILPPELSNNGTEMLLKTDTQIGLNYLLESTTNLANPVWMTTSTTAGTGDIITNTVPISPAQPSVFYRYVAQ